ncbi:MAG: hypothetical protein ACYDCO_23305 [Armatimonadota bacterium]
MGRPAGYHYIVALCVTGLVFSAIVCCAFIIIEGWPYLLLFLLDGLYFLLAIMLMGSGRGYRLALLMPLAAFPLWGALIYVLSIIIDFFAHGLEGTHSDSLGELMLYLLIAGVLVLPFWLIFHVPYWRILKRPAIKQALQNR